PRRIVAPRFENCLLIVSWLSICRDRAGSACRICVGDIRGTVMVSMIQTRNLAAAAALMMLPASLASAQSPADFYKGKNLEFYIGYSVGGGYDLYARTIARHIGKHIPGNPTIVPKNMEGAGSLRLANWLFRV